MIIDPNSRDLETSFKIQYMELNSCKSIKIKDTRMRFLDWITRYIFDIED